MKIRRLLREAVLKSLYAHEMGNEDLNEVIQYTLKPSINDILSNIKDSASDDGITASDAEKFAVRLFRETINQTEELDREIEPHLVHWEIDRLAIVDKLVLRMAICEMIVFEDVPTKVSINEAIEIAKKYSTGKSGKFVNGILDSALQKLSSDKRIHKMGRGLVEHSTNESRADNFRDGKAIKSSSKS